MASLKLLADTPLRHKQRVVPCATGNRYRAKGLSRLKMPFLDSYTLNADSDRLADTSMHSLDFTFNRLSMKLVKTESIDVVKDCQIVRAALLLICRSTMYFYCEWFCRFCNKL